MAEKQWTPEQRDAIDARGGSVLVSAAAGSGKTAVLVERVTGRILDPIHPVDADRMLVVTFSNAAALEMKQRLIARISGLLAENPADRTLQRQQLLLERAQISTIHSFCLELIRSGFHQLGIAANTRIADEKELEILRFDCAEQAVEQMYAGENSAAFEQTIELISAGRDDQRVFHTLFSLYDFIRTHPFYGNWMREKLALYDADTPVGRTPWGEIVMAYAAESAAYAHSRLQSARALAQEDESIEKAYGPALDSDLAQTEQVTRAIAARVWDDVCLTLDSLDKKRLGAVRGDSPDKEQVKQLREEAWKLLTALRDDCFCATETQFYDDVLFLRPLIAALFELTERFDCLFTDAKRQRSMMDFADLEQFAIELLAMPAADGFTPTALARSVRERYDEVLIDEFQDVNAAQEIIFRAVSRDESNLFMVGDVKQSIYRFRQARPELFIEKKKRYADYDGATFPAKITLGKNFRSAPEITDGINLFFKLLMSETIGEIDYDAREALVPGAQYPPTSGRGCEICLIEGAESDVAAQAEAEYVAGRIAQMLEQGMLVADSGGMRKVRPSDFCILMRSPARKGRLYQEALTRLGVPVWGEPRGGFLGSREIAPVIALLRIILNPMQDVELAAAMLSPLFSFTEDALAQIRLCDKSAPFYTAVCACATQGDARCAAFLQTLAELRGVAAGAAADDLLRKIYEMTDYPAKVRVMRMGQARLANLLLLVRYAGDYHAGGYQGASGFIRLIDRLCERGGDLAPAVSLSERADVVRVMSVHRSKGLEFPIVFLCDCAKQFNREDLRGITLLHSELGFACVRRDFERMIQYPTVPLQAARLELERSMLSEELRLLYVAMTRAKERLIMTALVKDAAQRVCAKSYAPDETGKLAPGVVRGAGCYLDWLLMAGGLHPAAAELLGDRAQTPPAWLLEIPLTLTVARADVQDTDAAADARLCAPPDPALCAKLAERLAFRYPFARQTEIPTKMAVSQIAERASAAQRRFARRPTFLEGEGLTPAQKGSAMHLFMQFADYAAAANDLPAEIERLAKRGFLSRAEAEVLDQARLAAFFGGGLAKRIFAADKVYRELRFLLEAGREELGEYLDLFDEDGKTAIQGVADCVFIENGHAVIVDYKTDRVKTPDELAERYRVQLELYRHALGAGLGVSVEECVLYSFALSREVRL